MARLSRPDDKREIALVLGGGAAQGAYEAGVLRVLMKRRIRVRRIVAASSGALNGVALASGVRSQREQAAIEELCEAWENHASFCDIVRPSPMDIVQMRGLSGPGKLIGLLQRYVKPCKAADPARVELHLVVAPLNGLKTRLDGSTATTYTKVLGFAGEDFDSREALSRVFVAAAASAALPILFAPIDVPGVGPCSDGGLVNNMPLLPAYGDDRGASLDAIVMVTPSPAFVPAPSAPYRGLGLLNHQLNMVLGEWLFQYLHRSLAMNESLARIEAATEKYGWPREIVRAVVDLLELEAVKPLPVVSIRPEERLPGGLLSGLFHPELRRSYVRVGMQRAEQALDAVGWD